MKKTKKIELYKVKGCGNLYIDAEGKPYTVRPKATFRGGRDMQDVTLHISKSEYFKEGTTLFLKNIVAKTLIDENARYVKCKDGNPLNCRPDNLEVSNTFTYTPKHTKENSFTCKICGKQIFKNRDNYKDELCCSCKHALKVMEKEKAKSNNFKNIYEYLDKNRKYFRQTDLRNNILEKFSEGKNYSQTAREIGVTRQCVHLSIQNAFETIEKKKKFKEQNNG